jgi:cbb3-type cytochrome oxidase subunit 3
LGLPEEPNSGGDKTAVTISDYGAVVSAIATRVGTIVLLLFLVRILVPLYRYNKRLSAYYDARVDALELAHSNRREGDSELELFERLTPSLSPDHIDFSEAPASPTQEVLDFVRQVFTSKLSK